MSSYRHTFDTGEQALVEALYLELVAPDEGKARAASMVAGIIVAQNELDEATLELCRAAARERFDAEAR